jgi:hypothetical protein
MKTFFALFFCTIFGFMLSKIPVTSKPVEESHHEIAAGTNPILITMEKATSRFETTMRNCLGPDCFDEKVRLSDGSKIDRVGLLAPLNSGGEDLLVILKKLGKQPNSKAKFPRAPVDLVYETHVPTYGYGKNHGWSRIIRLSRKIMPHAVSLMSGINVGQGSLNVNTENKEKKLSKIVDIQVRQLVRWHCRLSHVAAHTKLLTG